MDFSNLERMDPKETERAPSEEVEAIVVVSVADYIPKGVSVRSRIDSMMFTTKATVAQIENLHQDENVKSVQASEKLRFIQEQSESCG